MCVSFYCLLAKKQTNLLIFYKFDKFVGSLFYFRFENAYSGTKINFIEVKMRQKTKEKRSNFLFRMDVESVIRPFVEERQYLRMSVRIESNSSLTLNFV